MRPGLSPIWTEVGNGSVDPQRFGFLVFNALRKRRSAVLLALGFLGAWLLNPLCNRAEAGLVILRPDMGGNQKDGTTLSWDFGDMLIGTSESTTSFSIRNQNDPRAPELAS